MLHPLLEHARAVLLDLDGTIYSAGSLIPGAERVIAILRERQAPFRFITNSTMRPRRQLVNFMDYLGISCAAEDILNPATAAATWLQSLHPGAPVYLLVTKAAREEFADLPQNDAEAKFVIVGDMGDEWTYGGLNAGFRLVLGGAGLIALGKSRYWLANDGLRLDAGPFVAALEYATRHESLVIGKPQPAYYTQALESLNARPEEVVMVGDDIDADIAGAQRAGCHTILVRTGKYTKADLQKGIWPDAVVDSIADLIG